MHTFLVFISNLAVFALSLYFGINWGVSSASSVGGKVGLSFLGVIVLVFVFELVLGFIFRITKPRDPLYEAIMSSLYAHPTWPAVRSMSPAEQDTVIAGMVARRKGHLDPTAEKPKIRFSDRVERAKEAPPLKWG